MPLVTRKVTQKVPTLFGEITVDHTFYLPQARVQHGEVIADPGKEQLSDLALRFPDEASGIRVKLEGEEKARVLTFLELARHRGVKPMDPAPIEESGPTTETIEAMASAAARMFPMLGEAAAIKMVEQTPDVSTLRAFFEAELDSGRERKKVVAAFRARGLMLVEADAPAGEDLGGTTDGDEVEE